jgi:hypothetical protein
MAYERAMLPRGLDDIYLSLRNAEMMFSRPS